ncbi:MAG: hypothetical protein ACLRMZ_13370 [Blautia marasmi]
MVLAGTGGVFFLLYLLAMIPDLTKYIPTKLMSSYSLLPQAAEVSDFTYAVLAAAISLW